MSREAPLHRHSPTARAALVLLPLFLAWLGGLAGCQRAANVSTHVALEVWLGASDDPLSAWQLACVTPGEFAVPPGASVRLVPVDRAAFGDSELWQVARDFAGVATLHELDLAGTAITDSGAPLLGRLGSLRTLSLASTSIGDTGLAGIAGLTELRELDLSRTAVSAPGLGRLGELQGLRRLVLRHTRVSDTGIGAVANLTGVRALDLADTEITDAAMASLATMPSLELLFANDSRVTRDGAGVIRRARPACHVWCSTTGPTDTPPPTSAGRSRSRGRPLSVAPTPEAGDRGGPAQSAHS